MWSLVLFCFLTSSTNRVYDGCRQKNQGADLAMDLVSGQARSGCWAGEREKEAQGHGPGSVTIWGMTFYFQNL